MDQILKSVPYNDLIPLTNQLGLLGSLAPTFGRQKAYISNLINNRRIFYEACRQSRDENNRQAVRLKYHPMCENKIKIFNFIFYILNGNGIRNCIIGL